MRTASLPEKIFQPGYLDRTSLDTLPLHLNSLYFDALFTLSFVTLHAARMLLLLRSVSLDELNY